ncbi:MAG: ATP-binding protein [Bacteroidales bacterium]|nr:ATP-binding protein [Bacteroidales bacterium]
MSKKIKPLNPFFTGRTTIPDEYFCDREAETKELIKKLTNGSNVVLKSPRRIGKSSLIEHLFCQPEIRDNYNTLYVDIFGTKTMEEFVKEFQNALLEAPFAKTERGRTEVRNMLKDLYFQINFSEFSGLPNSVRVGVSPSQGVTMTLSAIFGFLEKTERPNIIVFDEFQKIKEYSEDAAAMIRSHVQRMTNANFIFSGSSRHLLNQMFEYPNEPFYRSASSMNLDIIPLESYSSFCERLFSEYGRGIEADAVNLVYCLFSGNTYDMQETMKETFTEVPEGSTVVKQDILNAIDNLLDSRDQEFRGMLDKVESAKARKVIACIAREGIATRLTSADKLKSYKLDNASSVQNAIKVLSGESLNFVKKVGKASYSLNNRFFEYWHSRRDGYLEEKIENAADRFNWERSLEKE